MADWYAFEALETAWEKTYDLLFPFDLGTWLRLFLIVILTGSGLNFPTSFGNFGTSGHTDAPSNDFSSTSAALEGVQQPLTGAFATSTGSSAMSVLLIVLGLLSLSVILFFMLIGSVFELIYYQSLIDDNVKIRANFRKHFRKGISYFGFRLTSSLLAILLIGFSIAGFAISPIIGVLMIIGSLFFIIPIAIILGLTNNFVLPRMIEADEKVIEAWRNIYDDLENEWRQVGVYIIIRFFVKMLTGLISAFWALTMLVLVGIPFGILVVIAYFTIKWLIVIPVVLGLIVYIILLIAGKIPIQTYLYSYALMVYRRIST